jgi:peptidoglycan/LPS O-acetylase OafA/YrhL
VGRMWTHDPGSIVTIRRADEILTGAVLLMVWEGMLGARLPALLKRVPTAVWFALTVASCMGQLGPLQYLRPYLAMCLLGSVLLKPEGRTARAMQVKWLVYIASISYAMYVVHGALFNLPWFAPKEKVLLYARRPVGLLLVWGLAHVSTRTYEAWWIGHGKRWAGRWLRRTEERLRRAEEHAGMLAYPVSESAQ